MTATNKPITVKEIEALWSDDFQLYPAPNFPSELGGLMAFKEGRPKYALDEAGKLIGLNLAATGLDDDKWDKIIDILGKALIFIKVLNLSDNQLTGNFDLLAGFTALQRLDLSGNQLKTFPAPNHVTALVEIQLGGNPLSFPPPEIVQQGSKGVLAWLNSFEKGTDQDEHFLKEIKLLIVGEGAAGKTSLLKQIKGLPFNQQENQTHGVNVESLEMGKLSLFDAFASMKEVVLHVWDFGGQEIMHASHQFFLTHRSIYIFVIDSRTDNKKDYWLRHIQKFGGASPAIVVINKIDDNTSYSLEESSLNKKYPFIGNRFLKLSCKSGKGKTAFAQTLAELIPETPLFKTPISGAWLKIKNQLASETATKQYIDRKRFLEICQAHGEDTPAGQETLLQYLNSLGVVLHFPGLAYKEFYVLDPHWVTIGVYKIINSTSIVNGVLDENQLEYILNEEDQKKAAYDPSKEKNIVYEAKEQLYLIGIMKEFELLYEYKKGYYLIPNLLPKERTSAQVLKEDEALSFIMDYDFLPPIVISRFIIHMKNDIIGLGKLWRTGALFYNEKFACSASVAADMDQQRISIQVSGDERRKREYFSIILHGLCAINDKFADLEVTEKMPVPGHPEILYDYEELLGLEKMEEDRLVIGRLKKVFSVSRDFLDKVSTKEQRQHYQKGNRMDIYVKTDHAELKEDLEFLKKTTQHTKKNTKAILDNQDLAEEYLEHLLVHAEKHKATLAALFLQIDASKNEAAELGRINRFLEERLNHYFKDLSPAIERVQRWEETKEKLAHAADAKWKLKFKLPLIFGSLEKEFSWDTKAGIKLIRQELVALQKGEKTLKQLFIEDDED
ncbi:MAG: COR domain-containing protein [Saprospiraceae bacterium]